MPFNSTLPLASSEISSAELRAQFNGLKDLIDTMQATIDSLQTSLNALSADVTAGLADRPTTAELPAIIEGDSARSIIGMSDLTISFSDPPTAAELDMVVEKLNALIAALQA
jgi:hypothetical protein